MAEFETDCCVVGGGPAGAVLALLLARQGVRVTLLEAHADFNREFRGDTIHPSTLDLLEQMGLLDRLVQMPHTRHQVVTLNTRHGSVPYFDTRRLQARHPYWLRLPQARFLEFLTAEAACFPNFRILMGARVEALIEHQGRVVGVRYRSGAGLCELRARLVVGADGRFSRVRELAGMRRTLSAQPIDVLWFVLPSSPSDPQTAGGLYATENRLTFIRNRGDHWQIAYVLPKQGYQQLRAAGLEVVRCDLQQLLPWMADRLPLLTDWSQTSLFSVDSSRVRRWYRPGLLLIGDAAHVMSPVAGVGINMAIQDAVVSANVLGPRLRTGEVQVQDLAAVQRRRELPTRLVQLLQDLFLQYVLTCAAERVTLHALAMRMVERFPFTTWLRTRLFGFGGFTSERISSQFDSAAHLVGR